MNLRDDARRPDEAMPHEAPFGRSIHKMSKKSKSKQYGKPYTKKDFKQAGVGLLVVGVLAMIYGISVYQFGAEEYMAQTKVGNQIYGPTPARSLLHLLIAVGGGVISLSGVFLWKRGTNKN